MPPIPVSMTRDDAIWSLRKFGTCQSSVKKLTRVQIERSNKLTLTLRAQCYTLPGLLSLDAPHQGLGSLESCVLDSLSSSLHWRLARVRGVKIPGEWQESFTDVEEL